MEENRHYGALRVNRRVPHDVHKVVFQRSVTVERGESANSIRKKSNPKIYTKGISGDETNCWSTSEIDPENYLESKGFHVKSNGYLESTFRALSDESDEEEPQQIDFQIKKRRKKYLRI